MVTLGFGVLAIPTLADGIQKAVNPLLPGDTFLTGPRTSGYEPPETLDPITQAIVDWSLDHSKPFEGQDAPALPNWLEPTTSRPDDIPGGSSGQQLVDWTLSLPTLGGGSGEK